MKLQSRRWFLAPLRQLRTRRLMARHGPTLPYDTAWALITLHTADEGALVRAWAREDFDGPPGVHYDHWHDLSKAEQRRRRRWLRHHGHSPIQLLHLDIPLVHSAGLHVLDWGHPPSPDGQRSTTTSSRPRARGQRSATTDRSPWQDGG